MDQRQQRLRIPRLEHQAVVLVTLAEGVDEILAPDLVGPEAVRCGVVFQVPGEHLEDQGDCGQALLAVIDQTGRPVGVEGIDGDDVHDGSEEVLAHVLTLAGVENVVQSWRQCRCVQAYLRWLTGMRNCGDCLMKSRRRVSEVRMGCSGSVGRGPGPLRDTRDRTPPNAPRDSWRCESTSSGHRRCLAIEPTLVGIEHGMRDARKRSTEDTWP